LQVIVWGGSPVDYLRTIADKFAPRLSNLKEFVAKPVVPTEIG